MGLVYDVYVLNTLLNCLANIFLGILVTEVPWSFFICDQMISGGIFWVVQFLQRKIH